MYQHNRNFAPLIGLDHSQTSVLVRFARQEKTLVLVVMEFVEGDPKRCRSVALELPVVVSVTNVDDA